MGVAGKEIIHYVKFYEYGRTTEKKGSQMGTNETIYIYITYICMNAHIYTAILRRGGQSYRHLIFAFGRLLLLIEYFVEFDLIFV